LAEFDSTLSLEPAVSFYDDFKPSTQYRPELHDDMPLANLHQENDLSTLHPKKARLGMLLRMS